MELLKALGDPRNIHIILTIIAIGAISFMVESLLDIMHDRGDPPLLCRARRLSLAGMAAALTYTLYYSYIMNWDPWPPYLWILVTLDANLIIGCVTLRHRANQLREEKSERTVNDIGYAFHKRKHLIS